MVDQLIDRTVILVRDNVEQPPVALEDRVDCPGEGIEDEIPWHRGEPHPPGVPSLDRGVLNDGVGAATTNERRHQISRTNLQQPQAFELAPSDRIGTPIAKGGEHRYAEDLSVVRPPGDVHRLAIELHHFVILATIDNP